MNPLLTMARAAAAAAALVVSALGAHAAVVGVSPNADLGEGAFTVDLGDASYTFGDSGEVGGFFGRPLPSVTTGGSAEVVFNPAILGGDVATYFTDEGRRPFIGPSILGNFMGTDGPATIDAQTGSFIALRFDLDDGTHFGFARLSGLTLFDFAYETDAGVGVRARPGPYDPIPEAPAPIPVPASLPLLGLGLAGLAAARRRLA